MLAQKRRSKFGSGLSANQAKGQSRCFHPQIEVLEDRRLLSTLPMLLADINPGSGGSSPSQFVGVTF